MSHAETATSEEERIHALEGRVQRLETVLDGIQQLVGVELFATTDAVTYAFLLFIQRKAARALEKP